MGTYAPHEALERLKQLHAEEKIEVVVLGWPLQEDGIEGEAVAVVAPFEKRLMRQLPEVQVVRWDERYTSVQARRAILESGARRKARRDRGRVDAAAAAIILQEYLDSQKG
jgi:putative Holliday junction resolvase